MKYYCVTGEMTEMTEMTVMAAAVADNQLAALGWTGGKGRLVGVEVIPGTYRRGEIAATDGEGTQQSVQVRGLAVGFIRVRIIRNITKDEISKAGTDAKLALRAQFSVPLAVRPVVRLELPAKPPLHVMRAKLFVRRARDENRMILAIGNTAPLLRLAMIRSRNEYMQQARAALAQGNV